MKVVILAGGLGTRLNEETALKPKPMVEIGGHPILWHILKTYAFFGYNEFVLALGYKGDQIKDFFLNFLPRNSDFTVDLSSGATTVRDRRSPDWRIHLIDTGPDSQTGGRLWRLKDLLSHETFMLTYGDGVAKINISDLVAFHKAHNKIATVTAVRPPARFGAIKWDDEGLVNAFHEKPQVGEGWINGGFFVFKPEIFNYLTDESTILEREPLENLSADRQLAAFPLDEFWHPMDTLRDKRLLEELWSTGKAPWKVWS